MNNRTEAAWESVNTELFVCLRVSPCVHRQNGSIFSKHCFGSRVCVWVRACVRVAVIHWPDSSSWGSAHIPVITAVPTADWLLQHRSGDICPSVRHTVDFKPNTPEWCWQYAPDIEELWSGFNYQSDSTKLISKLSVKRPTSGITVTPWHQRSSHLFYCVFSQWKGTRWEYKTERNHLLSSGQVYTLQNYP